LRNVGPRQTFELARDLIETSMQLAELFAVTDSFAALGNMSCFGDIVRRCHVKGAFGLATRFFLAYALGVARFIAGAFDFAPGFVTRTLDFESFLAGAFGFAARLFADTLSFTRLLPSARRFPHAPLAFGL
jgi:dihydrodipicolinate synthase/N-acetylneuraminate lyase